MKITDNGTSVDFIFGISKELLNDMRGMSRLDSRKELFELLFMELEQCIDKSLSFEVIPRLENKDSNVAEVYDAKCPRCGVNFNLDLGHLCSDRT